MKRDKIFLLTFLILYFVLIQIIIYLSKATYHWEIILLEFASISLLMIIFAFYCLLFYKKILKSYINGDYDKVIKMSNKFLKISSKRGLGEYTIMMLGIAYFSNNNKELFEKNINKITNRKIIAAKYYWLTIELIIEDKWEEAKNQFAFFIDKKYSEHYDFYYDILNTLFNIHDDSIINKQEEIDRLLLVVKNKKIISFLEKLKKK